MHAEALNEDAMTGSRKGKMQIGGHFDPRDVFTLQEVLARESRERGRRKTVQEALDEMVREYCAKRGVKLPSDGGKE
jgi:hypothetical protein